MADDESTIKREDRTTNDITEDGLVSVPNA